MHSNDLTAAWTERALRACGAIDDATTITGVEIAPVGTGQVADSVRVRPSYRGGDGPRTVVAKVSSDNAQARAAGRSELNYMREVNFYRHLGARVPARVATCFHAEIDSNDTEFVLLLEDLGPARAGNQLVGCTPAETELAVVQAARFHAPFWRSDELRGAAWLDISDSYWARFEEMMPTWFASFKGRFADVMDPADLEFAGRFVADIGKYYDRLRAMPYTVQHGDFRPDNVLFDVQGQPGTLAVVDWQTVIFGPGVVDVAYFIGGALDARTRRVHEDSLLATYLAELRTLGVEDYSQQDLERDYAVATFANVIIGVAAAALVERSARGDALFTSMVTNAVAHARDRHGLDIVLATPEVAGV